MKKFLDILIILLLTLLLFSLFTKNDKDEILNWTLDIGFEKTKYTIPASVWVYVNNLTGSWISLNTCNDINILSSWEKIIFSENFCNEVSILSWERTIINYSDEYYRFDKTWRYTLNSSIDEKEFFDQFELKNKGAFSKLFIGLFYAPIYNLIIWLVDLFSWSFGWAVVWVTIILRTLLIWPQHKMMVSQRKLQALQPKIKKIQEEFKWNQQMLWMKMMELYKNEKVNPVWSCWFLLIQMPILIVIYYIIIWIQDPANIFYLYWFLSNFSLDQIDFNFYWLDLLASWWIQWFILALSVAAIQFIQIKLSLIIKGKDEKKDGVVLEKKKDDNKYSQMMPDPDMINKFMLYGMPVMVWIFTFTLFAAVWIYWWISTLFMLFQQLIVNKIIKK